VLSSAYVFGFAKTEGKSIPTPPPIIFFILLDFWITFSYN